MAAPQVIVFLPDNANVNNVLDNIVSELSLTVDSLPLGFPYTFSAQQRDLPTYLLIEYDPNASDVIMDIIKWEKPTDEFKQSLADCRSTITVHYRGLDVAKRCLSVISSCLGGTSSKCVIENGYGCLLLLSDIIHFISIDSTWTWERGAFPELEGVATSEWDD
jgi:hypothetical protein